MRPESGKMHSPLPSIQPGLARLAEKVPEGSQWVHEMKYDGYRVMSYIENGNVTLRTRNSLDWTSRFQKIADGLKMLGTISMILDGEMVVFDQTGLSSFSALKKALSNKSQNEFSYIVFDLLYLKGVDVRDRPLFERKRLLKGLIKKLDNTHIPIKSVSSIRAIA
jgi:bifunctional non-homologous end joining protein LigD